MVNYISGAPLWVIVLFIASFLYSIAFITKTVKKAAFNAGRTLLQSRNIQIGIFGFYMLYLAYVSVLALKGILDVNSMPPKVMILAGMPLLIILFGFVGNTALVKTLLRSTTLESLIKVHIFRLVGVFFIVLYCYHLLPAKFAFSAELGDMITALFALPVAWLVSRGKSWAITAVYIWNIFGILDVINLLVVAVVTGANENLREITIFPFVWFPAFAPATILFMHTLVFRKLLQAKSDMQVNKNQL